MNEHNTIRVFISKNPRTPPTIISVGDYGHSTNMVCIMKETTYQYGQEEKTRPC